MPRANPLNDFIVKTSKSSPKVHEPDRFCAELDCPTKLSVYNPRNTCYMHTPREISPGIPRI